MRKLATIRRINEIKNIEGAERICAYQVDGWWVVDAIDKYKINEIVVYIEPDAWVPYELAPFLCKSDTPRTYDGIPGERLRTVRLRGQISQGLVLPVERRNEQFCGWLDVITNTKGEETCVEEGEDVTDFLGIVKYEPPVPGQLSGIVDGGWPDGVPKTDQERIQNLVREFDTDYRVSGDRWEVTEKLEGSSGQFYLDREGKFRAMSRNLSLRETEGNSFWVIARQYEIERKMAELGLGGVTIQGEVCGPGIQGNIYNLKQVDFFVYDVYDTCGGGYWSSEARQELCVSMGLKHVPIINPELVLNKTDTVEFLLKYAEDVSLLNHKQQREGLVFKNINRPSVSMKCISNAYLMRSKL